jgi:ferredoxin-NADP reductase
MHVVTYVAVALSFTHQIRTGAHFAGNRPAQVAWTCLYAGVALVLVRYRVVAPLRAALRHRLRVREVKAESADVVSVTITGEHLAELRAAPGQFFRWRFLAPGLWWSSHPYSLSAPPAAGRLRITVKAVGDHSAALRRVQPGTRVLAQGPYGSFTGARRTSRKVLLIAGGVGVTPLRSLFETLPAEPGDLTFLYRARTLDDAVLRAELDEIAAARGARIHYLVGRRVELGNDPLGATSLAALVPDLRDHEVYVCGPAGMTAAVTATLRTAGVPRRSVHVESFDLEGV